MPATTAAATMEMETVRQGGVSTMKWHSAIHDYPSQDGESGRVKSASGA